MADFLPILITIYNKDLSRCKF